ncbi:IMP dehydrogenase [Candidatus Saccharibacteria bacterium]|nr:IMP dehydrogenase [Candidatus Saccharibacteria bacterium]
MSALEKSVFFDKMASEGLALTFDDVRLETASSEFSTSEVNIASRFSRNVELKTPIISAAMDTVTESAMAIAIAKLGGLGIIHAGLSIEEQRNEVRRVKLFLNGLIEKPVVVYESQSIENVLKVCEEKKFDFRTFPVVNSDGRFVGLLTQNDFDFCDDRSSSVGNIMTPADDVFNAPGNISVEQAQDLMKARKKKTLPLLNKDGTVAGLYVFSDVNRITQANYGQHNLDQRGRLRVGAAVPSDQEAIERVSELSKYLDVVVIDTAQGDSKFAFSTLKNLKEEFPELDVVVGNISASSSARKLAEAGADGIKVGQGPGSICTTRIETGIGSPQVTAVYECVKAIGNEDIPVCADGGIKEPGDISIAIASGASSVMMGSMLAGTKEAPGDLIKLENGSRVKLYRGMGSPSALKDNPASRKRYSVEGSGQPLSEGVESYIPYKGSVTELMDHYIKALRKSMSYVGAENIEEHRKNTRIVRITNAGMRESHPHDVKVI